MTTLREAAQQALEALETLVPTKGPSIYNSARDALRAALAQQDEPEGSVCARCGALAFDPLVKQQAEPVEPVAWKQGNLVTFNEDPYPALGGLFVQLWDGEEVAARVYANDLKTLRQRCAKVNTAPPQRKPLTEEEIDKIFKHLCNTVGASCKTMARAVERAHGIGEQP